MTPQALRRLLFLEASTFGAAALIHHGLLIGGYQHREAATAESVIALVLIAGGVATWLRQGSARTYGLVAQAFALVGTLVGIFTIAIGIGPRTVPDVAYHVGIVIALVLGVVAVARRRDRAMTADQPPRPVPLAMAGVIGPILFMLVVTIASLMRADYSQIRDPISDLGNGPRAWMQNANFTLFGVLLFCFALAFRRGMQSVLGRRTLVASATLLGLSAIGFLAAAYFPVPDAGAPEAVRVRQGMRHGMSFMLIFVPLIGALFLSGSQMLRRPRWRGTGWYSLAAGGIAILLIALIVQFAAPDSSFPIGGLLTRLLVVVTFAWHVLVGWRLARQSWHGA